MLRLDHAGRRNPILEVIRPMSALGGKRTLGPASVQPVFLAVQDARVLERLEDSPGRERTMPVVRKQVAVGDSGRDQRHDPSIATGQALIGVFHLSAHGINSCQRRRIRRLLEIKHGWEVSLGSDLGVRNGLKADLSS